MKALQVYESCPVYETSSFMLRLVKEEDAEDLLCCYSDLQAVAKMNRDFCTSDFYYTTVEQMAACIRFWLEEYRNHVYIRFAVVGKEESRAIGTVEIFGGENGVLRIDMAAAYDTETYIEELLRLAVLEFIGDFRIGSLKIKAVNTPERIPLLRKYGFVPSETFRPGLGYYERPVVRYFAPEKGVAFCGLACCVCSENVSCAGCRMDGCEGKDWCKSYTCCKADQLEGCWECRQFPCGYDMLQKLRVRTFAKYIAQNGEEKLIRALEKNEQNGVLYHYPGQLTGDYDLFEREEDIVRLIEKGL